MPSAEHATAALSRAFTAAFGEGGELLPRRHAAPYATSQFPASIAIKHEIYVRQNNTHAPRERERVADSDMREQISGTSSLMQSSKFRYDGLGYFLL